MRCLKKKRHRASKRPSMRTIYSGRSHAPGPILRHAVRLPAPRVSHTTQLWRSYQNRNIVLTFIQTWRLVVVLKSGHSFSEYQRSSISVVMFWM